MKRDLVLPKTGTCHTLKAAADGRYLSDSPEHSFRIPVPLTVDALPDLLGKPVVLFSQTGAILKRIEPELVSKVSTIGKRKMVKTGVLSPERASFLREKIVAGEKFFVLRFKRKPHQTATKYITQRPRGEVFPLSYAAKLECCKSGWKDNLSIAEKIRICSLITRTKLRSFDPVRLRKRHLPGTEGGGIPVMAHNLVVAPSPALLRRILDQKMPVDDVLECAARRGIEQLERRIGARIFAFAGLHMEGASSVRPHLHLRIIAYDSTGKYVPLFDRKSGSRKGGQVRMALR